MVFITRYLIARPLLTNLILILILLIAAASLPRIKRQGYPRVDFGRMDIQTVYPGASPEDVELNVTIKLEEALKRVTGIDRYISRSMENQSYIMVRIDPDAEDQEKVKAEIRRVIESVSDLPPEITERPLISEVKIDNWPVYEIALTIPPEKGKDAASLNSRGERLVRKHALNLKKKLLGLPEISQVLEEGIRDREIQILLDPDKMARRYISFDEVIHSIRMNKIRVSGGSLESYTSERGIVTLSELSSPRDVENIIIRSNFSGNRVRVKDVGRVVDDFKKRDSVIKYNGEPGVSLWAVKKGPADVVRAVDAVKRVIAQYRKEYAPPGIRFHSTWDASIETKNRLSLLYGNAALGLFLVIIILFIFLDRKIALWTALGIPLSVGITLILLPIFNITLNSISLLGLVAVLGMVVDDAIIIAESIYRSREAGLPAKESALQGLRTVIKPVFGTIITTMIAFLPMYFLPGMVGDFSREIPSIVIIMLAASFFEATTILPAHLGMERKKKTKRAPPSPPPGRVLLNVLETLYVKILRRVLRHRLAAFLGFLVFLIGGGTLGALFARIDMFPADQAYKMWIQGDLPRDSNLQYTGRAAIALEKTIRSLPPGLVQSYKTLVGQRYDSASDSGQLAASSFMTQLILVPSSERDRSAFQVRDLLRDTVKAHTGKIPLKISFLIQTGGPPVGQPLEIQVLGQDNAKRLKIIQELQKDLARYPVSDIDTDYKTGKKELRLLPRYDVIAATGLNTAAVASTIRTAFDGTRTAYLQMPEERIDFRVMLDRPFRNFNDPLRGLYVRNPTGNLIPLKNLVRIQETQSQERYNHYQSYRSNLVTASVQKTFKNKDGQQVPVKISAANIYSELKKKYANFEKENPGYRIIFGGEAQESQAFMIRMGIALAIAILIIYFLLIIQFDSFTQPAMVILAIPFGLVGIMLAFWLQNYALSMLALIGILGFTGVVVNDSLIMVDFINRLKNTGSTEDPGLLDASAPVPVPSAPDDFHEAVIQGASIRLRPIILTTFTTVAGLIPTAYGLIGGFESFVSPMVMAMTWGLITGTLAVLIVIPVFYSLHEDLVNFLQKSFADIKRRAFLKKELSNGEQPS